MKLFRGINLIHGGRVPSNEFQSTTCQGAYRKKPVSLQITFNHTSVNCNMLCGIACMVSRANQVHMENMLRVQCIHTPYVADPRENPGAKFEYQEISEEYGPTKYAFVEAESKSSFIRQSNGKYIFELGDKKFELENVKKFGMPLLRA